MVSSMVFKCKMCGGDIVPIEGTNTGKCEFCKSVMTLPNSDNEKIINLYNRANDLRINNEFDKARKLYDNILEIDNKQIEAHWGILLCKYGVEYVDDPKTKKKIPTCHRTNDTSILTETDYKFIKKNAVGDALALYEEEAKTIDGIQKDILAISIKEEPYDVFICYKETDENGERTKDSVIAQDIYDKLVEQGLKVFFARITLEDKLGKEYEPYIYSALKSARVMLVVGTREEHFNAVWVKNEWSRFLEMMKADRSKSLIPVYSQIDAYKLPEEFAMLQAQSMDKIGAIQDLNRGVQKIVDEYKKRGNKKEEVSAKTSSVIEDYRSVGNGMYEVTVVKEKLPKWYYISIGVILFFGFLMFVDNIGGNYFDVRTGLDMMGYAQNISYVPLVLFVLFGLSMLGGLLAATINRQTHVQKNRILLGGFVALALSLITFLRDGYMITNFVSLIFDILLLATVIFVIVYKPKWHLNTDKKAIMNRDEIDKQMLKNKLIVEGFETKAKCAGIDKKIYIVVIVVIMLLGVHAAYLQLGRFPQTNVRDESKDQIEILTNTILFKKPQFYTTIGKIEAGEVYTILDTVGTGVRRFYKVRTAKGVTGYILGSTTKVLCSENSMECKSLTMQTNERDSNKMQLKVVVDYINIRQEAGDESALLGKVYRDEIYTILNKQAYYGDMTWYQIETTNGISGWITEGFGGTRYVEILRED